VLKRCEFLRVESGYETQPSEGEDSNAVWARRCSPWWCHGDEQKNAANKMATNNLTRLAVASPLRDRYGTGRGREDGRSTSFALVNVEPMMDYYIGNVARKG
jgi:hypothetical protein